MKVKIQQYDKKELLNEEQIRQLESDLVDLTVAEIPHLVCHAPIGHINIYYDGKVVISYYSFSGTIYCRTQKTILKGIYNCVEHYRKNFGNDTSKE